MVEFLNSKNIKLDNLDFPDEKPDSIMPPLKKKVIKRIPVPHYPNIDVPMSENEILEFKKKYPNRVIELKKEDQKVRNRLN